MTKNFFINRKTVLRASVFEDSLLPFLSLSLPVALSLSLRCASERKSSGLEPDSELVYFDFFIFCFFELRSEKSAIENSPVAFATLIGADWKSRWKNRKRERENLGKKAEEWRIN